MSYTTLDRRIRKVGVAAVIAASAIAVTACQSGGSTSSSHGSRSSHASSSKKSSDTSGHSGTGKNSAAIGSRAHNAGAVSPCAMGTLKATLDTGGTSQAGMNHLGTFLRVWNTGRQACSLSGYAGLALEGTGHTAIKTTAKHGSTYFATDPGTHPVILKPGGSAWADLVWSHTGASMAHAKYLQISPTGSNSHSTVAFDQSVDNSTLSLTAWAPKPPIND
jgi:hypothetical protein